MNRQDRADICWPEKADAQAVADHLVTILKQSNHKTIAVPGGNTPVPIFGILAKQSLQWRDVTLMLTDDRIVPTDHDASNHGKLAAAFSATAARILPLEEGVTPPVFDAVWLGMGTDGHIASLFPNMDPQMTSTPLVERKTPDPLPPEAPFERLSLNLAALVRTKNIMLVLHGQEKKRVLEDAIAGDNDLPIARLLAAVTCPVTVFWSEQ